MPAEEEDGDEGEQEAEEEVVIDEEEHDRIRQEILEVRAEYRLDDEDKFFYVRQRAWRRQCPHSWSRPGLCCVIRQGWCCNARWR